MIRALPGNSRRCAEAALPASGIVRRRVLRSNRFEGRKAVTSHRGAFRPSAAMEALGTVHSTLASIDTGIVSQPRGSTRWLQGFTSGPQQWKLGSSTGGNVMLQPKAGRIAPSERQALGNSDGLCGTGPGRRPGAHRCRPQGRIGHLVYGAEHHRGRASDRDGFESKYDIKVDVVRADRATTRCGSQPRARPARCRPTCSMGRPPRRR